MESRTFHRLPQVPLCHIVTSLILFIIRNVHKSTRTPTYLWVSPKELPAVVNHWSTKVRGGGGSTNGWMDLEGQKWFWNVELMSPQPFTMPWNECYAISPQFMVPFKRSIDSSNLYSTQNYSVAELFLNQVLVLNLISNVAQDDRLIGWKQREQTHPDRWNGMKKEKARVLLTPTTCWSSPFCHHTPTISGRKAPNMLFEFSLRRVDIIRAWWMDMRAVAVIFW